MKKYLTASKNPIDDINAVAYANQPLQNRLYKSGYEEYFEMLPALNDDDKFLDLKTAQSIAIMDALSTKLKHDPWTPSLAPLTGGFNRTILAMEPPKLQDLGYKEGSEIVLARWGDGKTSPVHGHADGMLYEQLLFGKMRVNTYRITDPIERIARPVETKIYTGFQNIASSYTRKQQHERSALVHNFTSIGYSASLHYVPEHTRDGIDNGFTVERFEDNYLLRDWNLEQLTAAKGIVNLKIGDVALVRSENVPEYGDHFIVITGKPILKEHGYRPQDTAIFAPNTKDILDMFKPIMGLTLLKLGSHAKKSFHDFHGILIDGDKVIFPKS